MTEYTREIWIRVLMLTVWIAFAIGGVMVIDPSRDTAAIAAFLIAATAGLSILRPFAARDTVVVAGGGFTGIEAATGRDLSGAVVEWLARRIAGAPSV